MTQEFKNQFELAAAALRAARKAKTEAEGTLDYAHSKMKKAVEEETSTSQRYFSLVNRMLEEPLT